MGGLQDKLLAHTIKLMVSEGSKARAVRSKLLLALVISVILALSAAALWLGRESSKKHTGNMLPIAVTRQIGTFKPYYLKPSYSTDFTLQQNTVKYDYGVLVFSMRNPTGKSLSITEEATPNQYDPSTLQTTKQFNTEYGQAYITDSTDRTTGTLFTSDKTWIIVNAASPVGSDFMQQFIEALAPLAR
jgi:hypothetical protein